ncbi:3-hydroxybutyryl-CoA dehydrogenase [Tepidibacillus decaturensis]|uniref:3-hydroxybutyryl-CoA dehydrogenase n=1 Tax=Tepidibacillus decaturensis TaxID=1413211 RepID=A0A135L4U7_9BACI|nr:3-hydroxybutyryl-CoA dehydrogenase [Tepidibacillus decaturensis]KXG43986.1 3-hydroxybutyryl-CoA dehydrogenase [Tepidibacillus decaturensis]
MSIQKIMVIGAGQMGSGIAQVAAQTGFQVILQDIKDEYLARGLKVIEKNLTHNIEKGKISVEEKEQILARFQLTTELGLASEADFIIEAATENMGTKTKIFQELDQIARPDVILASNTSSLPITEIAAVTGRPNQVIGMHFMNPVPVMPLVEVIRGLATTDVVYQTVENLAKTMKKTPVEVNDFPGFISNRVLLPMINEAIYTVYEGVATPEAVDQVMKLGMNHPMGPLELADFIGLDTCLSIMEILHEGLGDSKYRPCPLLRKYVKAGWLGRKTGRGFYVYE